MTGRPRFGAWPATVRGFRPALALCRRRIGGRRPAGVGGVLVSARFESFQAFEERQDRKTHTQRGLWPIFRRDAESLWPGGRSNPVAHEAISSWLVSVSVP
jgi:hypothetical protein